MLNKSHGKTHLIRVVGVVEHGVIPIFIPLLTLSADVLAKFTEALRRFRDSTVLHLDELYNNNLEEVPNLFLSLAQVTHANLYR